MKRVTDAAIAQAAPVRIQRKRTKGFNLQAASPNGLPVVSVCRPGKWGNPFKVEPSADYRSTPEQAVGSFKDWLFGRAFIEDHQRKRLYIVMHIHELRGKNLACFCPLDSPCHADVLLREANKEPNG